MEGQTPMAPAPIDLNNSHIPRSSRQKGIPPLLIAIVAIIVLLLVVIAVMLTSTQKSTSSNNVNTEKQQKIPDGTPTPMLSITVQPLSEKDINEVQNIDLGDINADLKELEQEINTL